MSNLWGFWECSSSGEDGKRMDELGDKDGRREESLDRLQVGAVVGDVPVPTKLQDSRG